MAQPAVSLQNLEFRFEQKPIIKGLSLDFEPNKIHCLIGASGCGKTTTLRLMNGLLRPQKGEVFHNGQAFDFKKGVTRPFGKRDMGL